jgi:hypothetical protein
MKTGFLSRFEIESFGRREKTGRFGRLLSVSEGFGVVRFIIIISGAVGGLFGFVIGIKGDHGVET